jgi:hypothetical protein
MLLVCSLGRSKYVRPRTRRVDMKVAPLKTGRGFDTGPAHRKLRASRK